MPLYLCKGSYTVEGIKGLLKDGGTRRESDCAKAYEAVGGKMHRFYYALGDTDIYIIAELPDNITVAMASIVTNVAGTSQMTYTPLLTPEEMDQSVEMANKMMGAYRPPGA